MQAGPRFESHANNSILHFVERMVVDSIEQWLIEEVTSGYFRGCNRTTAATIRRLAPKITISHLELR